MPSGPPLASTLSFLMALLIRPGLKTILLKRVLEVLSELLTD